MSEREALTLMALNDLNKRVGALEAQNQLDYKNAFEDQVSISDALRAELKEAVTRVVDLANELGDTKRELEGYLTTNRWLVSLLRKKGYTF